MKVYTQAGLSGFLAAAVVLSIFGERNDGTVQAASDPDAKAALEKAPAVGINLDFVVDWTPSWVFVDAFRSARPWLTQKPHTMEVWDSGEELATTTFGWPLLESHQAAATLLMREIDGHYPAGVYTCFYRGEGDIEFGMDATVISSEPGKIQVNVTPTDSGIFFKINESDPSNPIREVRVVLPGFEETYLSDPFHPEFTSRLEPFGILRFMNWQRINETWISNWWERGHPRAFTQATDRGVAFEYIAKLCSQNDSDPWICIPHLATDEFVVEMAKFLGKGLDPDRTIYVEYSNEVWNSIFPQAQYAEAQGLAEGLASDPFQARLHWYSKRAVETLNLFKQTVEQHNGNAPTVVRVMGAQYGNPWTSEVVLEYQDAYTQIDALAVAPYFGIDLGSPANLWSTLGLTTTQVLAACKDEIVTEMDELVGLHAEVANENGVTLISYEGGQHLVGFSGNENVQDLTELFLDANRDPGMYGLYTDMLHVWRSHTMGPFVAYSNCRQYSNWGSWGATEYQDQPIWEAHKYRALADFGVQN